MVCCCIVSLAIYILFCAVGSYTSRSRFNRGQSFRANDVYGPLRSCLYIRVRFYRVNTLGVLSGMKKRCGSGNRSFAGVVTVDLKRSTVSSFSLVIFSKWNFYILCPSGKKKLLLFSQELKSRQSLPEQVKFYSKN